MKYIKKIVKNHIKVNKLSFFSSIILYFSSAALAMLPAKIIQLIIDEGFLKRNITSLLTYIALLLCSYLLKILFTYISNRNLIELSTSLLKKIKNEIYVRLMSMDFSFYSKNEIGYINSRVEEIGAIDSIFSTQTLTFMSSILEFLMALIILYSLNWKMLLLLSIPIPFLLIISYFTSKKINRQVLDTLDSAAKYNGKMQDTLRGIETVKSQGLEKTESKKIDEYNKKAIDNRKKQSHTMNKFSVGMGSVGYIITILLYLIGGLFFIYDDLSMGSFIAISTYATKLYSPIMSYSSLALIIQPAYAAMIRVSDFFFNESEDKSKKVLIDTINNIELKDLCFSYDEKKEVLQNVNYKINCGEKIQLIGSNGCGKSTIIRILLKLVKAKNGMVYVNSIDLNQIDKMSIIKNISYVAQKNYVFNDSIENNIKYGVKNPDENLYNSIIDGLNLQNVINRLGNVNEKIGENGARLSGGEIQKICIARALMLNKDIFIFDEALVNLDKKSFDYIMDVIENSTATWIVVDHQLDLKKFGFKELKLNN